MTTAVADVPVQAPMPELTVPVQSPKVLTEQEKEIKELRDTVNDMAASILKLEQTVASNQACMEKLVTMLETSQNRIEKLLEEKQSVGRLAQYAQTAANVVFVIGGVVTFVRFVPGAASSVFDGLSMASDFRDDNLFRAARSLREFSDRSQDGLRRFFQTQPVRA